MEQPSTILERIVDDFAALVPRGCSCSIELVSVDSAPNIRGVSHIEGRRRASQFEFDRLAASASSRITELVPLGYKWKLSFRVFGDLRPYYASEGFGIGDDSQKKRKGAK